MYFWHRRGWLIQVFLITRNRFTPQVRTSCSVNALHRRRNRFHGGRNRPCGLKSPLTLSGPEFIAHYLAWFCPNLLSLMNKLILFLRYARRSIAQNAPPRANYLAISVLPSSELLPR
jgi:hypothetical protein